MGATKWQYRSDFLKCFSRRDEGKEGEEVMNPNGRNANWRMPKTNTILSPITGACLPFTTGVAEEKKNKMCTPLVCSLLLDAAQTKRRKVLLYILSTVPLHIFGALVGKKGLRTVADKTVAASLTRANFYG
ncbi:hypothetical protein K435DRAFT_807648 [Dendrothele bispora CBS 962.96]|uniref:Uncharacterized protein n=1 Tax=Dendrothele bispora (strain CBS 962.96) TaxID=1314807 RepID=A0A4S8L3Z9_DENBC|nr:hypothetical protein K435DRAFT_807648 [Dendrothele bispora CBS 962.96]